MIERREFFVHPDIPLTDFARTITYWCHCSLIRPHYSVHSITIISSVSLSPLLVVHPAISIIIILHLFLLHLPWIPATRSAEVRAIIYIPRPRTTHPSSNTGHHLNQAALTPHLPANTSCIVLKNASHQRQRSMREWWNAIYQNYHDLLRVTNMAA